MKKVLFIDADDKLTALAADAFKGAGFDFVPVKTCAEGLAKAKEIKPDLIICDMFFNGKAEGVLLARALRRNEKNADLSKIPFIMMSDIKINQGIVFPKPSSRPLRFPIDELVFKPIVKTDELLKKSQELAK